MKLGEKDILKLTFQVVDKEAGKGVQPHQTFLRFYDEKSGEEGIQPVRVTPGGKAKFELVRIEDRSKDYWNTHEMIECGQTTTVPPTNHD